MGIELLISSIPRHSTNDVFIADKIFPKLQTAKQTGKYYIYDKSNLRIDKTNRAAGSGANEIDFGVSLAS